MRQALVGGIYDNLHNANTEYNNLQGGGICNAAEAKVDQIIPTGGTIGSLYIELSAAPGGGKSYTFTLMLNGAPTALAVQIADTATTGNLVGTEIAVVATDLVSLRCVPAGTPAAAFAMWTSVFTSTIAAESIYMEHCYPNKTSTVYYCISGYGSAGTSTQGRAWHPTPIAGTYKKMYVEAAGSPGAAPDAYEIKLRKGPADSGIGVTLDDTNWTGVSDLVNTAAAIAGDTWCWEIAPISTPAANPDVRVSIVFLADTDGESMVIFNDRSYMPSDTDTVYKSNADVTAWNATEARAQSLCQATTLDKMYYYGRIAPGAGKQRVFSLRVEGGDSGVTVTVSDAETTESDLVNSVIVSAGNTIGLKSVPTGTPTDSELAISFRSVVAAAGWSGKIAGVTDPASIMGVDVVNIAEVKGVA